MPTTAKRRLVIVGSPRAQLATGSLLRIARDFPAILRKYEIHATAETADAILGTGFYQRDDFPPHRSGDQGGITELAAMIARDEVAAAILFLDPGDAWSDAVENRALARVCIHRHVRLITTYSAALRWITFEADEWAGREPDGNQAQWQPDNWVSGNKNVDAAGEFKQLPIGERSVALISHDGKKHEMVDFIKTGEHLELLAKHQRILATGTTGWLLKLLFCDDPSRYKHMLDGNLKRRERLCETIVSILKKKKISAPQFAGFDDLLQLLRGEMEGRKSAEFAEKVMPLPSGPDGGDVIAAEEILENTLHEVIFFQDPLEAHPHSEDIRLFERTSRLRGVFSECVSDLQSAYQWMEGFSREAGGTRPVPAYAQQLRARFGLKEVVLVDPVHNDDSDELGKQLARACAGFLNHWMTARERERSTRVGVAWGWGLREVLTQVSLLHSAQLLKKAPTPPNMVWSPIIGFITAEVSDQEASMIADGFASFYGGEVKLLGCAGFTKGELTIPREAEETVKSLENADLILTSGSAWNETASLATYTGLDTTKLPPFDRAVATVSGVFLDADGNEVQGVYRIAGLTYEGLQKAANKGHVVLICGGKERNPVVLAALRARVVSVLVTTQQTAEWVLTQCADDVLREPVVEGPVPVAAQHIPVRKEEGATAPSREEPGERPRPIAQQT